MSTRNSKEVAERLVDIFWSPPPLKDKEYLVKRVQVELEKAYEIGREDGISRAYKLAYDDALKFLKENR